MIVYGTEVKSDIAFPLNLSQETETRYEVELSSHIPVELKNAIICGFPFYVSHGRQVYLYSSQDSDDVTLGQVWCYEVQDLLKFYWKSGKKVIYYEQYEKCDVKLLSFWFIHLLLPLYLTSENIYEFFHAGAVEVDGKPILFIAPTMGGKSTMTDYFLRQGHTLISDDKVATFIEKDRFIVVSSHPYHRPYRRNEDLGYYVNNVSLNFKPIFAFYILERVAADMEITIKEITGLQKLDYIFPNYLYSFSYLRSKRLKYLSKMLNNIKVFNIRVPDNLDRLNEVYDQIVQHHRSR